MEKYLVKKGTNSSNKRSKVTSDSSQQPSGAGADAQDHSDGTEDEPDHSKAKQQKESFSLKEARGDLFAAPKHDSLAHCISADVRMGKGIAKIFKQKFGGVQELLSQGVKPGGVAVLKRGTRYIYYMVTKEKFWNKPTYDSLRKSLEAMADHCHSNGVKALAMPRIGCGLDGLKWDRVKGLVEETFRDLDLTVTVYTL